MRVTEFKDTELLRELLIRDRVGHAYLLGDLDPSYLPFCRWFGVEEDGTILALALFYKGLRLPTLLTATRDHSSHCVEALDVVLGEIKHQLPEQVWIHAWDHHLEVTQRHFSCQNIQQMQRMSTRPGPWLESTSASSQTTVRRLGHRDTAAIVALYQYYPDHFFEPYQLESGLYFGVHGPDNTLAAIAGVHVFSQAYDIAAIGNITTHPDFRKHGYASAVTLRLLEELFKSVSLVTLNVRQNNAAATALFKKFGFVHHHTYCEGMVETQP